MDQLDDREAALLYDMLVSQVPRVEEPVSEPATHVGPSQDSLRSDVELTIEPDVITERPALLDAVSPIPGAPWPARRSVLELPASFVPLLAEESRLVRWLTEGNSVAARRAIEHRRIARVAMIVRDIAWEALRDVLPPQRRAEVDSLVAGDEVPAALSRSMEAIATLLVTMLTDTKHMVVLTARGMDAGYVAALRRHAAMLRAAERAARADEEAPRRWGVLRLIRTAYRVLRTEAFVAVLRGGG